MTRAAGSSSFYRFALMRGDAADEDCVIELPSVTTVLSALSKPALVPWAYRQTLASLGEIAARGVPLGEATPDELDGILKELRLRPFDKRDQAASRGTDVHGYLERLVGADEFPEAANGYEAAVLDWFQTRKVAHAKDLHAEQPVFSLRHGYAGTTDIVHDGTLTDLKTGKAIYDEAGLQVRAYAEAWNEMGRPPVTRTTVLLAHEDGTWEEKETDAPFDIFLGLLAVWRWQAQQKNGRKK